MLLLAAVALCVAACGGSSGDANTLLEQTFDGTHRIDSGDLSLNLTIQPSGSRTVTGLVTISFSGPFEALGSAAPRSDITVSLSVLGRTTSLGLLSTGTNGYVTVRGTSYQLPQSAFQQLRSSLAQLQPAGVGSAGSAAGAALGIQPLRWFKRAVIVGDQNVGGTDTTHIRADVNVGALLDDLDKFLHNASSLGVPAASLPAGLSAASRTRLAEQVENPRVDVWTGRSDKTLRKLSIALTVPVSAQASDQLGGLRAANIVLSMQYAGLNRPQAITAPATVRPYSELANDVSSSQQQLAASGGTDSTGAAANGSSAPAGPSTTGSSNSSAGAQTYTQCVEVAGSDITKLQQCAPLLNGK